MTAPCNLHQQGHSDEVNLCEEEICHDSPSCQSGCCIGYTGSGFGDNHGVCVNNGSNPCEPLKEGSACFSGKECATGICAASVCRSSGDVSMLYLAAIVIVVVILFIGILVCICRYKNRKDTDVTTTPNQHYRSMARNNGDVSPKLLLDST